MKRPGIILSCVTAAVLCSGCISSKLIDGINDQPIFHRYEVVSFHRAWLSPDRTLSVCFTGTEPGRPGQTNDYTATVVLPGTPKGAEQFSRYRHTDVQFQGLGVALPKKNIRRGWIIESQIRKDQLTEVPIVSLTAVHPGKARLDQGKLAAERAEAIRGIISEKHPVWVIDDRAYTSQLPWWPHDSFLCVIPDETSWPNHVETIALEYCTPDYAEKMKWLLLPVTIAADIVLLPVEAVSCVVLVVILKSSGGLHF